MITGKDILALGIEPGPHIRPMLERCRAAGAVSRELIADLIPAPTIPLRTNSIPFEVFLDPETEDERVNHDAVVRHMDALMRTPTIRKGAVMPDACPSGSAPGTIPVGGVVACENAIHPGFHSSDICCSMAFSMLSRETDAGRVLDVAMRETHFGPCKTPRFQHDSPDYRKILSAFEDNPFLKGLEFFAERDLVTQGDGNHFFYVGDLHGKTVIVTHHGSRGLGARLYKRGKACAERMTKKIAPKVPKHNAWIPADSQEGRDYWEALQIIRAWTRLNHFEIHKRVGKALGVRIDDWWWNEHNFVFRRSDGLYYHGKGATPAYEGFASDDRGLTLIPMNMGREILVTEHQTRAPNEKALGFAPHGAGRNLSRTAHMRKLEAEFGPLTRETKARIIEEETRGVDVRFYAGRADLSELPSAYKSADQVIAGIERHGLARVTARIEPLGSMMAGEVFVPRRQKQKTEGPA